MTPRERNGLLACIVCLVLQAVQSYGGGVPLLPHSRQLDGVMFVTDEKQGLPQAQTNAMAAQAVIDYLSANSKNGFRNFDVNMPPQQLAQAPEYWRTMYAAHGPPPQVIIDNGGRLEPMPLPASVDAMLTLLKQYGEKK